MCSLQIHVEGDVLTGVCLPELQNDSSLLHQLDMLLATSTVWILVLVPQNTDSFGVKTGGVAHHPSKPSSMSAMDRGKMEQKFVCQDF